MWKNVKTTKKIFNEKCAMGSLHLLVVHHLIILLFSFFFIIKQIIKLSFVEEDVSSFFFCLWLLTHLNHIFIIFIYIFFSIDFLVHAHFSQSLTSPLKSSLLLIKGAASEDLKGSYQKKLSYFDLFRRYVHIQKFSVVHNFIIWRN